jgi:hypothetical protein
MADGLDIHVSGDDELRAKLEKLALHLSDLRPFWGLVVPLVHGWMQSQFSTEGAWGGRAWAPLAPSTVVEKQRTHPGRSILIREGGLRHASSQMRREAGPRTLTMWIDDEVASFHQEGTSRMPARPLIPEPLAASAVRDVELAAEHHVNVLVRALGL